MSIELDTDYRDQSKWYEVSVYRSGTRTIIADLDTTAEAEAWVERAESQDAKNGVQVDYSISPVRGENDCS